MSAKRVSLDTNILIYAIDKDAGKKQTLAVKLIENCALNLDCVLTLQVIVGKEYTKLRRIFVCLQGATIGA